MERREFVEVISAALASVLASARATPYSAASAFAASLSPTAPWEYLTPAQAHLLDVVTAHLVPTDDTPGAREAHVVRFIDHALATFFKDQQKDFTDMLAGFDTFMSHYRPDNVPFLELSAREQVDALGELERLEPDVFGPLRGLTMLGMFSHPQHGGNNRKIGWQLIGYVDQYSWAPPFGYYDRT